MTGSPRDAPAAPAHLPGRTGVVLVNHDSADDTVACVASLEASHDLDLDIVVVDNSDSPASADELRALARPPRRGRQQRRQPRVRRRQQRRHHPVPRAWQRVRLAAQPRHPGRARDAAPAPRRSSTTSPTAAWSAPGSSTPASPPPSGSTAASSTRTSTARPGTCTRAGRSTTRPPRAARRGRLRHRGLAAGPPDHAGDGGAAAGGLLPLLRGDRLVPPRAPGGVAGHRRPAGPHGAPQEVERGPARRPTICTT